MIDNFFEGLERIIDKVSLGDEYPSLYSPTTKKRAKYAVTVNYPFKRGHRWETVCYAMEDDWRMLLTDATEKWDDLDVIIVSVKYPGYHRAVSTAELRQLDKRYRDWWMRSEL